MISEKDLTKEAEVKMQQAVDSLAVALSRIRAGRANPAILNDIRIEYFGNKVPLSNVANISVPDAKTIIIQPWEKTLIKTIEKALLESPIGITPDNNGEVIRLTIPSLTEERRKELVKQTRKDAEEAKVSIRNARREAIDVIKKAIKSGESGASEDLEKDFTDTIQKVHDKYIGKVEELIGEKEKEILTV